METQGLAGAEAKVIGFNPSDRTARFSGMTWRARLRHALRRLHDLSASPSTLIGATTLVFLAIVGLDAYQTLQGVQVGLEANSRLLAAHLADIEVTAADAVLARSREVLPPGTDLALSDWHAADRNTGFVLASATQSPGTPFSPRLMASRPIVGPLGEVTVSSALFPILIPVMQRAGLVALGLFSLMFIALRRGEAASMGAPGGRDFADMLADYRAGLAYFSPAGRLISANRAFRSRLMALKADLKPGARHDQIIAAISRLGIPAILEEAEGYRHSQFRDEDVATIGLEEVYSGDGSLLLVLSDRAEQARLGSKIEALGGEIRGLNQIIQQQKLVAEAAKRSTKSFLAHLNHEIRTPLNHIIGFADLIKHQSYGPLGDKRYVTYVGHIKQSGENLLSGISKILELADFQTGQVAMKKERIGADELLAWARQRYRDSAERSGIRFEVETDCPMDIEADRLGLQRMLGNVLENAMRFTPAGGEVALKAWTADGGLVLEISDTGIGIGPDRLEILNQSFALGPASFKLDQHKTGTGVAIARTIAEINGGQLAIDSSLTIGTTVAISLPAAARAATSSRVA